MVGDIGRDADRLTAGLPHVGDRAVESRLSAGEHRDVIPVLGELPHGRASNAGGSAGDDRNLAST